MSRFINIIRRNLTPSVIAWSALMIIELVIVIIAVRNLLADPSSGADKALIGSAFCVFLSGFISLKRERYKKENRKVESENKEL